MHDAQAGPRPYVMVSMDHRAWQLGFAAGAAGQANQTPDSLDDLAWSSGYIEGQAQRDGFTTLPLRPRPGHPTQDDPC